jgi:hypothetical protein
VIVHDDGFSDWEAPAAGEHAPPEGAVTVPDWPF